MYNINNNYFLLYIMKGIKTNKNNYVKRKINKGGLIAIRLISSRKPLGNRTLKIRLWSKQIVVVRINIFYFFL